MRHKSILAGAALLLASAAPASAGVYADDLGKCVVVHMSPQDQQDLIRWIFGAMALHPGIKPYAKISDEERDGFTRKAGHLIERLLTEDCRTQSETAIRNEGAPSIETAFKLAGEVAMRTLMTHPDVTANLATLDKYVDAQKIKALGGQ